MYDNRLHFVAVSPGSDQFYRIIGEDYETVDGLRKVYTQEALQNEFELSGKGPVTCSSTCSICGRDLAALDYARALRGYYN